jgi:hypothetical protein
MRRQTPISCLCLLYFIRLTSSLAADPHPSHALQARHAEYAAYCAATLGYLVPHDDSVQDTSPGSALSIGWAATQAAWAAQHTAARELWRAGAMRRPAPASERLAGAGAASARWPVLLGLGNSPWRPGVALLGNMLTATNLSSVNERHAAAGGGPLHSLPLRLCSFGGEAGAVALGAPAGLRIEVLRTAGGAGATVSLRDELVSAGTSLAGAIWLPGQRCAYARAQSCAGVCRRARALAFGL